MSTVKVVSAGATVVLDPSDKRVIAFDWDAENLKPGVAITASAFGIAVIRQRGATALTKDNEARLSAAQASTALDRTVSADNRVTSVRLLATTATAGDEYFVSSFVTTDEVPAQEKEQRIRIVIEDR